MDNLAWLVPTLAILNFFLVLAWHFFSYKKDFFDQYSPMNKKIMGVLVEDFYESITLWMTERKKKAKKEDLSELIESLKYLFTKSQKLSSWNDHITKGNLLLRKGASNMAMTGVLLSSAVVVFALLFDVDFSLGILLAFVIGYVGLLCLYRGISDWREFCKIESTIDENYSDLTLGKSMVTKRNEGFE